MDLERRMLQLSRWKKKGIILSLLAVGVERRDTFEPYTERGINRLDAEYDRQS